MEQQPISLVCSLSCKAMNDLLVDSESFDCHSSRASLLLRREGVYDWGPLLPLLSSLDRSLLKTDSLTLHTRGDGSGCDT